MHDFKYKNNELYCEQVRIAEIADKVSTPFYLYSYNTLLSHYRKLAAAFRALSGYLLFNEGKL